MATSFYPNVTAAIEEHLTCFIDLAIPGDHHWCTISSEHAVARTLTLRTIASAVDANPAGASPAASQPFSFEEWFVPRYPYFCLYILVCIYEYIRHEFHGGRHSLLGPIVSFLAFYLFGSLDSDPQLKILKKHYADEFDKWLSNILAGNRA
jgi:hypothetical protein